MHINLILGLLAFSSLSLAAPAWVPFDEASLQKRFAKPVLNDGPNCYNTAFIALGYQQETLHTSTFETLFYLKNFCQQQNLPAAKAPNGALIAYFSATSDLVHIAANLGGARVLEKTTYAGTHRATPRDQSHPGEYLFHNLASSYYFKSYSAKNTKVFYCLPSEEVHRRLASIDSLPEVQSLFRLRQDLAQELQILQPENLDVFFTESALNILKDILEVLQEKPATRLEQDYIRSLASSLQNQIGFMLEGAPISCQRCHRKVTRPVQEALDRVSFIFAKNYSRTDWGPE